MTMDRRALPYHFPTLGLPLLGSNVLLAQDTMKPAKPAQLAPELVKEFVRVGHNNLPEVQRMLKEHPGLLNASWDVGGGDFETALEGAGHVGDREIAEYLIGQGARAATSPLYRLAMPPRRDLMVRPCSPPPFIMPHEAANRRRSCWSTSKGSGSRR